MKKYKLDIRVLGELTEIKEFLELLSVIKYLGVVGSSREVKLVVDGDGSGRLSFGVKYEDTDWTEIGMPNEKLKSDIRNGEDIKLYIGE